MQSKTSLPAWDETEELPSWDSTEALPAWDETEAVADSGIGGAESASKGLFDSLSLGFDDEIAGGLEATGRAFGVKGLGAPNFSDTEFASPEGFSNFSENYTQARDARRILKNRSEEANPEMFLGGQVVGGVALPGGAARSIGKGVATAAAQGATYGAGSSDELLTAPRDAVIGGGVGLLGGAAAHGAGKALKSTFTPERVGKAASFFSGVDEEAAMRQLQRPRQTKIAEGDDFIYNTGNKAMKEIESRGQRLGSKVADARDSLISKKGSKLPMSVAAKVEDTVGDIERFLARNAPSSQGHSAITPNQAEELTQLAEFVRFGKVEDLVKLREVLDQKEKLATKYGKDVVSVFDRQLMRTRGMIDSALDSYDQTFNKANTNFSQYMDKKGVLGLNSESRAESIVGNLFGQNKTGKQRAAEDLLKPGTFESIKDISANKAFDAAKKPGGDNYFRRNALGVLTLGVSEFLTNSQNWKGGLRGLGSMGEKLGKYGKVLESAAQRGGNSLAVTHHLLQSQDPEYQKMINDLEEQGQSVP